MVQRVASLLIAVTIGTALPKAGALTRDEWRRVFERTAAPHSQPAAGVKAGGAPYTNFSRTKYIKTTGGKIHGHWADSFAQACIETFDATIEAASVISKEKAGKCANGDDVMKYVHN